MLIINNRHHNRGSAGKASDKTANRLDTGTLSFSDIENKADYKVKHHSISMGTSGPNMPPTVVNKSDHTNSTTQSAVEQGTLIIRDSDKLQQDITQLSRDTEHANQVLDKIFDKDKMLDTIEQAELVNSIVQQALTVLENQDKLKAQHALEAQGGPTQKDKAQAEQQLKEIFEKRRETDPNTPEPTQQQIDNLAYNNAKNHLYNTHFNSTGIGSDTRQALLAASSVIQGLVTGNIVGGLAGASAPYLAEQIKHATYERDEQGKLRFDEQGNPLVNKEANTLAHILLGAATAQLQGGSALAGGVGAGTGELAADFIYQQLYKDTDKKDLSETQKKEISALASLAAGLAVASTGEGGQAIATGVQTGQTAVENNYLTKDRPQGYTERFTSCHHITFINHW